MKKKFFLISTGIISSIAFLTLVSVADGHKVKVCHKGSMIEVSSSALAAHVAHGDFVCDEHGVDPTGTYGDEVQVIDNEANCECPR